LIGIFNSKSFLIIDETPQDASESDRQRDEGESNCILTLDGFLASVFRAVVYASVLAARDQ
jgi:hypothetical protein